MRFAACLFLALLALSFRTMSLAQAMETPSGSVYSAPLPPIVTDAGGNRWQIMNGMVYENGKPDTVSGNAVQILYYNHVVYDQDMFGNWWQMPGDAPMSGDPRTGGTHTGQAPTVTAVAPNSGPVTGGTSVTLTGTSFGGTTAVNFGNVAATSYTVNSATSITATSPAEALSTVDVTVTTTLGTSATGASDRYSFITPLAPPAVASLSLSSGSTAGGTVITVTGTGFTSVSSVMFGNAPAASYVVNSATSITATSPAEAAGTVDVIVTSAYGTSPAVAGDQFTFNAVTGPVIAAVSPNNSIPGGGVAVAVTGTGFTGASAVKFGTTAAVSYVVNSATSITAVAPVGVAGPVDITVTTASGTSATGNGDQFTYNAASPYYTCSSYKYVATGRGNDSTGTGAIGAPYATISKAVSVLPGAGASAGTCVVVAPGTYTQSAWLNISKGGNANTLTGYTAYVSATPGAALINTTTNVGGDLIGLGGGNISVKGAPYIIFDGFTVDGGNESFGNVAYTAVNTSGSCVDIESNHHVKVLNSVLHDCGKAGVNAPWDDFIDVVGNTVYNTAWYNPAHGSGIGLYEPWDFTGYTKNSNDTGATYRNNILNNIVYNNSELYQNVGAYGKTDGNGIIMDDFIDAQHNNNWVPANTNYAPRSLVQGNTVYNNGGGGIHVFISSNVTVNNNIAYLNYWDAGLSNTAWRGDINATGDGTNPANGNTFTNNHAMSAVAAGGGCPPYTNILTCNTAAGDYGNTAANSNTWTGNYVYDSNTHTWSFGADQMSLAAFESTNHLGGSLP